MKKEGLMRGELREWKRGQKKEFVNVMKGAIFDGEGWGKNPPAKMRGRKRKNAEAAMKTIGGEDVQVVGAVMAAGMNDNVMETETDVAAI